MEEVDIMSYIVRKEIQEIRRGIGTCLYNLSLIKKYPDNNKPSSKKDYSERLSLTLKHFNRLRRTYPDLFNPRTKQLKLDL